MRLQEGPRRVIVGLEGPSPGIGGQGGPRPVICDGARGLLPPTSPNPLRKLEKTNWTRLTFVEPSTHLVGVAHQDETRAES